jgi:hypothetical protein
MNAIVNTKKTSAIDEDDGQTHFSQETLKRTFLDNLFLCTGKIPRVAVFERRSVAKEI